MASSSARSAASSSPVPLAAATGLLGGSDFIRLLAAWGGAAPAAVGRAPFGERLSAWFAWTDAIALSSALGGPAAPVPPGLWSPAERLATEERELARVRQQLLVHLRGDPTSARRTGGATRVAVSPRVQARLAAEGADDEGFALHRQRYLAAQKAMDNAIGSLRQRVRDAVAAASPALAHLATLDVVMEDVVGARARSLLAQVPSLLAQRYERLQTDGVDDLNLRFRRELQPLLEAELAFRLQPVEGLLDALRQAATP